MNSPDLTTGQLQKLWTFLDHRFDALCASLAEPATFADTPRDPRSAEVRLEAAALAADVFTALAWSVVPLRRRTDMLDVAAAARRMWDLGGRGVQDVRAFVAQRVPAQWRELVLAEAYRDVDGEPRAPRAPEYAAVYVAEPVSADDAGLGVGLVVSQMIAEAGDGATVLLESPDHNGRYA